MAWPARMAAREMAMKVTVRRSTKGSGRVAGEYIG
jgi:hypothetical protein